MCFFFFFARHPPIIVVHPSLYFSAVSLVFGMLRFLFFIFLK